AAEAWPPPASAWTLRARPDSTLGDSAPSARVEYQVTFTTSTGTQTRFERLGTANVLEYYPEWMERSAGMLHFETAPLTQPLGIAGHVLAHLKVASSEPDAAIFVY